MVHSVYSETDIFLRELISNASDACDRLRYEAIARPELHGRRRAARDPHHAGQDRRHADHRRQRHRHGPAGADRQSRHRGALRHARLHEQARRGEGRRRPDRPVRRRLLFGLHGGGPHRRSTSRRAGSAEAWVWTSTGGAGFEIAPAERGAGGARAARHRDRAAPEGRREEISRAARDPPRGLDLFGPHPVPDRARRDRGGQGGREQGEPRPRRSIRRARCGSGRSPSSSRRTTSRPTRPSRTPSTSPR